jgi:excisionase family DNA binding protein
VRNTFNEPTNIPAASRDILNETQAAELLGVQPRTCRLWRKTRGLPHIRITAKEIRFRRSDIDAWLAGLRVATVG